MNTARFFTALLGWKQGAPRGDMMRGATRGPMGRVSCAPAGNAGGGGVLHRIFEAWADARPRSPAVVDGEASITYGALDRKANQVARRLRSIGVRRGSTVGLLQPRSIDAYASLLGILKAGAAYVPVDPEYPPDRVAYMLSNAGAAAVLTTDALADRAAGWNGAVLRADTDASRFSAERTDRLAQSRDDARPEDLCYVIYTSGSTGRPKGVMVEHRNAAHLVCAERAVYSVRSRDHVFQGASLAFDLSVEEIWMAFSTGATLVSSGSTMGRAGSEISRFLSEHAVTVLSCVPTLLSLVTDDVPTLRLVILGGESCPGELVERWHRPWRRIVNTYGPTETTVIATCGDLRPGSPVTLGQAIPGYRVYVLDEQLRAAAEGQVGEICIAGPGVARGYVGLPAMTAARFVPDPYAPPGEEGARMYRSGDRGRFDEKGRLEFHGRSDGQVKLRGFRIELAEVESALMREGEVLAAACTVRGEPGGLQQLVGYVVPRDGAPVDEAGLRARRGRCATGSISAGTM